MVHYLEWCQNTLNRTYTRGLFKKLKYFNPRIRELYESMMSYEKNHRVENNKVISELYLDMCLKFSLSDTSKCNLTLTHMWNIKIFKNKMYL